MLKTIKSTLLLVLPTLEFLEYPKNKWSKTSLINFEGGKKESLRGKVVNGKGIADYSQVQ